MKSHVGYNSTFRNTTWANLGSSWCGLVHSITNIFVRPSYERLHTCVSYVQWVIYMLRKHVKKMFHYSNPLLFIIKWNNLQSEIYVTNTTTKEGYIAIQISSQTTKKKVSENPQLRTTISRKLLSSYETITFTPVQSQVLRNSRNWYNRKTFPIIISSIHHLQFPVHRKLFATNPSPQRLTESTQNSIGFWYKI
jgi:hypothetical protein